MDAYCFPADHVERDGAANNGSIAYVECGRVANRDHACPDGSTGCLAARQFGWTIRSRVSSYDGSADDYGSSGRSRYPTRTCADGDAEDANASGRDLSAEFE